MRNYQQSTDSFRFTGFAGDEVGNVYEVDFTSKRRMVMGALPKQAQFLDDHHTLVLLCPKPAMIERAGNGNLTCARPVV